MKNIEIKEKYKDKVFSGKDIKEIISSSNYSNIRGRTGNIDLLFHIIEPKMKDDKEIYVGIQGIFFKEELPSNITF